MLDFIKEIQFMKDVENGNVIRMLGAVTVDTPMMIIYEHAALGSLKTYLEQARSSGAMSMTQQLQICFDVAQGSKYLAERQIVHRDIVCVTV